MSSRKINDITPMPKRRPEVPKPDVTPPAPLNKPHSRPPQNIDGFIKPNKQVPLSHLAPLRFTPVKSAQPVRPAILPIAKLPLAPPPAARSVRQDVGPPLARPPAVNRPAHQVGSAALPLPSALPRPVVAQEPVLKKPAAQPVAKPRTNQLQTWQYSLIMGAVLGAMLVLKVPLVDAAILGYFVAAIVLPIESKWSFGAALILLALQPLLAVFKLTGAAEHYAVYAFYFLCIGVVSAVLEYRREK